MTPNDTGTFEAKLRNNRAVRRRDYKNPEPAKKDRLRNTDTAILSYSTSVSYYKCLFGTAFQKHN